jgi:hypothetical protein
MIPRKARRGVDRAKYVCRGRIEHGPGFCSQPSIRRERIDVPLLATLLEDGYYEDLQATIRRVQQGHSADLAAARQAEAEAARELAAVDRRLARVVRGWQDEVIGDDEYARQRAELESVHEGATAAVRQSEARVRQLEQGGPPDAEQAVLDHLARFKRAVGEGVGAAPDLLAQRNVIGDLFESVTLVRSGTWPQGVGEGFIPWHHDTPTVTDGPERYWLLFVLRWSAVDRDTFEPTGQAIPVGCNPQYPPSTEAETFFSRYLWWYSSAK